MNSTDRLDGCFLAFHAFAGNAADGALPAETFPALVQVRPVVLDKGVPGVAVTTSCRATALLGLSCDDAIALGDRLRELVWVSEEGGLAADVQGPQDVARQIPRLAVRVVRGQAVLHAGPAFLLDDGDAEGCGAALIVSAAWAKATADAA